MASAAASLQFLSLASQTISLSTSNPRLAAPSLSFFSSLKPLLPKLISLSSSIPGASFTLCAAAPSRFSRNVSISSDYSETEEYEDEADFSPDLKLFVGNLPFSVDSSALAGLFGRAGNVELVEVIYDKITGTSRGFAFVTMSTAEEVEAAIIQFNGYELDGRALRVNSGMAPPRRERDNFSSRGGERDNFSSRGERNGFSSRGERDNFSSRRDRNGFSSRGERDNFSSRGERNGFSSRGERNGFASRGERNGFSSRGERNDFSSRGERNGFSSRGERNDFSSRGERGGGRNFNNGNKVFVGNLDWGVDDMALETLFSEQGRVLEAKVVYDRESGRSRGFGFVTYGSSNEVNKAVQALDGADLNGREIRVSAAEEKSRHEF